MKQSQLMLPTLREVPAEAEMASHRLMLRAGIVRPLVSGVYIFLPLGKRVLQKIETIVREEMNRAGAQEVLLPTLQPGELWRQSGRWENYGPELMRLKDRHGREMVLGPTHEEVVTALVRDEVNTYRKLPLILYQIQTKFRDELRPRSGVLRGREFLMKDAYSFDADEEGMNHSYRLMVDAYNRILTRVGLNYRVVEADAGTIGGRGTHEFMVLSEAGEDTIVTCSACAYAANIEMAEVRTSVPDAQAVKETRGVGEEPLKARSLVHTPQKKTVEEVSSFLSVKPEEMIKTLLYEADGRLVAVLVRGDHEVNESKVRNCLKVNKLMLASQEKVQRVTHAAVGFAGPVDLNVQIIADQAVQGMPEAVIGANRTDFHTLHVVPGRDFEVSFYADLRNIEEGDACPRCGAKVHFSRGIEVGHVFKGLPYAKKMGAVFLDESGKPQTMWMGCYGIGISRLMAAIVEQCHDEAGITWPLAVAPFTVHLLPVNVKNETQAALTRDLYHFFSEQGIEVLLDDRDERVGVKLNDADLIGLPLRVLVGKKATEGVVELKFCRSGEVEEWTVVSLKENIWSVLNERLN